MAGLIEIRDRLLSDRMITKNEVAAIRNFIAEDGQLDYQDIKFLVALMKEADHVCQEFDDLLFPCLRQVILADGEVTPDEHYLLLQMLYSDGKVRDRERDFMAEILQAVDNVTPELRQLCETASAASETDWCVGGR